MTPLERALLKRISDEGSITVEAYMEACNQYYYTTRDPLGTCGDFTTAPEISQMFGEMVGAALADAWKRAGAPADVIYAELGPGRGTLASDALRILRTSGFRGESHLVETSPLLQAMQEQLVPGGVWHEDIADLPAAPLLLVANEFLDALPIRQHVAGVERRVQVAAGGLAFDRDGDTVETSPARDGAVAAIATCLAARGGVALFIDYGYVKSGTGDTFQAMRSHRHTPVLADPGEQDLTAHVDFEALVTVARAAGALVTAVTGQGKWLMRLGIEARAAALSRANPDRAPEIEVALDRLTSGDQMGDLFKAVAIHSPDWPAPAGFA